jgi:putative phage-type endonuclease
MRKKMSLTEAQLEQRLDYITGSDAAVICGVSPFGNIIDLWRQKLRLAENEDISWKPSVKAGNYLEPVVSQWFSDETGKVCEVDTEFKIHKTIPFMAGNIDRRITGENAILECKTTSRDDNWGSDGDNVIPDYYLLQCAHYACVCDVDRVYVAVLIRGVDFRWYTYDRNAKLEELLIQKEKQFWECVQNQVPPEPRTPEEVVSLYSQATNEEPLIANDELEQAIMVLQDAKAMIKKHETLARNAEMVIKSFMRDHNTLHDRNGKIIATWKNAKGAVRFDAKKFALEHEKLYDQYLKTSESGRRFVLK